MQSNKNSKAMKKVITLIVPIGFAFVTITSCSSSSNSMRDDVKKLVELECKEEKIREKISNNEKEMEKCNEGRSHLLSLLDEGKREEYKRKKEEFEKEYEKLKEEYKKLEEEYLKIDKEIKKLSDELQRKYYSKEDQEKLSEEYRKVQGNCEEFTN